MVYSASQMRWYKGVTVAMASAREGVWPQALQTGRLSARHDTVSNEMRFRVIPVPMRPLLPAKAGSKRATLNSSRLLKIDVLIRQEIGSSVFAEANSRQRSGLVAPEFIRGALAHEILKP